MKKLSFRRQVAHWGLIFAIVLTSLPAGATPESESFTFGRQVSVRSLKNPCAFYLLRAGDTDRAFQLTPDRSPTQLAGVLEGFQSESKELLSQLKITDLTGVAIASVGAPLNGRSIAEEKAAMRAMLDERGLSHIAVKVFPRPANALENVLSHRIIESDRVPTENDPQSTRRGLQITGAANLTTLVVLTYVAYYAEASTPVGIAVAVTATVANLIIDFQVGKHRSTVDNFIARAGDSRLSALVRDAEIGLVFVLPFFFIPRIGELLSGASQLPSTATGALWAGAAGVAQITASCFLQAFQIFSFMNPNANVNQILLDQGTQTPEAELDQKKVYRIAGFFAITAPIFGITASPYTQVPIPDAVFYPLGFLIPQAPEYLSGSTMNWGYLLMAAISGANYVALYNNPLRLTDGFFSIYEKFGKLLCDYPVEYGFVRPMGVLSEVATSLGRTVRHWAVSLLGKKPSSDE
jgi:hypothetical protein